MGVFYKLPTVEDRLAQSQYAMTLEEIGQVLGVSRERVRQIEQKALQKIARYHMPELKVMRAMANELRRRDGECGVIR